MSLGTGKGVPPGPRRRLLSGPTVALGLAYVVFSEWLNTQVLSPWA